MGEGRVDREGGGDGGGEREGRGRGMGGGGRGGDEEGAGARDEGRFEGTRKDWMTPLLISLFFCH